jgi:hypothetical protein
MERHYNLGNFYMQTDQLEPARRRSRWPRVAVGRVPPLVNAASCKRGWGESAARK